MKSATISKAGAAKIIAFVNQFHKDAETIALHDTYHFFYTEIEEGAQELEDGSFIGTCEIRSWDSTSGHTEDLTLEGADFDVEEIEE